MLASDVAFVVALHTLPDVAAFLNAPDPELLRGTLENPQRLSYIVEAGGAPVGMLLVALLKPWLIELRRLVIGEPRRGYGRAALRWALDDAFRQRGAHRVYLEVRADNLPARALYESLGFVLEGTWRDGSRSDAGRYFDLCAYGLLADEYPGAQTS
jgi:diamine N-acetyltransferase